MEALEISCKDFFGGSGIQYCAHVADVGWQDWKNSDTIAGTTGQNKKMEAIKIKLSGYIANYFDVYYRVHCADYGWLGWACNGESAGTTGGSKQMEEAIQIKIIRKGNGFDKGGTAYYDLSSSGGQSSSSSFEPIWSCEKPYAVSHTKGKQLADSLRNKVGISYPNGYCLKFVEESYQHAGGKRPYHCCASHSGDVYIQSSSKDNILLGATVYFGNCGGGSCKSCGNRYFGHVGIYVGERDSNKQTRPKETLIPAL